jgi:hypothetical protein
VRAEPSRLLRGLAKLAGVVLAAGVAGAGIGIGLARLGGGEESGAPDVAASSEATATATAPTTATTATTARAPYREPRFEVRSAQLATPATDPVAAVVTARVSVTNRNTYPLKPRPLVLTSERDEVPLDSAARDAARALLRAIGPGATATGTVRFNLPAAIAQRVRERKAARLRIAGRTITLNLELLPQPSG